MSNTTTLGTNVITIVPDGTTDWVWSGDLSAPLNGQMGLLVNAIEFVASGADTLIIRDRAVGGAVIYKITTASAVEGAPNRETYSGPKGSGRRMLPYIDASECTFGTAANCLIRFELA